MYTVYLHPVPDVAFPLSALAAKKTVERGKFREELHNPTRSVEKMLRRKPTRLELKIDDIEEFESVKKELEARKRQREEAESGGGGSSVISVDIISGGPSVSASSSSTASRTDLINERIGYKPHPKPATLPTLFGSLQF
ncbi:anaphase-promoting complex subunit CDC26 [Cynoglossus semilaevis]|uniref:Anaphase-promoting complex subunit CDC26 n=1 Tax=Cynoglossus semilaevis TaxID=244447 RepID=A0A3P8WZ78_CYNSE|nr:anaphase-promoting complex subunit CDC26 [Cynoglossus semilaevis]